MFGRESWRHPEIILKSFNEMSHDHSKKNKKNKKPTILDQAYLALFGIPEIGFQIRSLYFKKMLGKHLSKKKISKILDAGSGIGTYSFWLSKKFPNSYVDGWDIDKNKLRFSEKFCEELGISNVSFKFNDLYESQKGKNMYDLIINIDVLEHIKDYKKVLKNFYSLLVPGGYLFIHVPQPNQKRIFKQMESWHHDDHVREGIEEKVLKNDLKNIGFKITESRQTFGPLGKLAWELNHIALKKNFITAGIVYLLVYPLILLSQNFKTKNGFGVAILVRK